MRLSVKAFTFNPVQENTYVLYNEEGQCCIIDPGCYFPEERDEPDIDHLPRLVVDYNRLDFGRLREFIDAINDK